MPLQPESPQQPSSISAVHSQEADKGDFIEIIDLADTGLTEIRRRSMKMPKKKLQTLPASCPPSWIPGTTAATSHFQMRISWRSKTELMANRSSPVPPNF